MATGDTSVRVIASNSSVVPLRPPRRCSMFNSPEARVGLPFLVHLSPEARIGLLLLVPPGPEEVRLQIQVADAGIRFR